MKNKYIIICLILLLAVSLFSEDENDKVFQNAVTAYENFQYQQALEGFLTLKEAGINKADLYYNIANCYFRLNNIGNAVLYYKRALRQNPLHKMSQQNMKFAVSVRQDKTEQSDEYFISETFENIFNSIPLNLLSVILLILFGIIFFIINLIILRYRGREKTVPVFFLFITLAFFCVVSVLSYLKWQGYYYDKEAVLMTQTAIGYSGPGEDYTRLFTIHEGMDFSIEKTDGDWSFIKLPNSFGGWIKSDLYQRVYDPQDQ